MLGLSLPSCRWLRPPNPDYSGLTLIPLLEIICGLPSSYPAPCRLLIPRQLRRHHYDVILKRVQLTPVRPANLYDDSSSTNICPSRRSAAATAAPYWFAVDFAQWRSVWSMSDLPQGGHTHVARVRTVTGLSTMRLEAPRLQSVVIV
jgi:hypothetical protein